MTYLSQFNFLFRESPQLKLEILELLKQEMELLLDELNKQGQSDAEIYMAVHRLLNIVRILDLNELEEELIDLRIQINLQKTSPSLINKRVSSFKTKMEKRINIIGKKL